MPYQYATEREDYRDYASGRVLYGLVGQPAFPARLASEIMQRCMAACRREGAVGPYTLYDPCCGGAHLLTMLAYMHGDVIAEVVGSDVDERALALAERNLALLTVDGLERRNTEIDRMRQAYGKSSHVEALESAKRLRARLLEWARRHPIHTHLFQANATDGAALRDGLAGRHIDIVIADIPYGRHSSWQTDDRAQTSILSPVGRMLEALLSVASPTTVMAVTADKGQKIVHQEYQRVERFQIGKRQVALLRPG